MQNPLYAPSLTTFQNTENRFYFLTTLARAVPPWGRGRYNGPRKNRFRGACGAQKTRFPYVPAHFARCALRAQREAPFEGAATFLASGVANRVAPPLCKMHPPKCPFRARAAEYRQLYTTIVYNYSRYPQGRVPLLGNSQGTTPGNAAENRDFIGD